MNVHTDHGFKAELIKLHMHTPEHTGYKMINKQPPIQHERIYHSHKIVDPHMDSNKVGKYFYFQKGN